MRRQDYVYILTNKANTVLYTGMTNDLQRRVYEHREKLGNGFTKRYNVSKLVYYEIFDDPENAIFKREANKGRAKAEEGCVGRRYESGMGRLIRGAIGLAR